MYAGRIDLAGPVLGREAAIHTTQHLSMAEFAGFRNAQLGDSVSI
jgi:hypothetical protein